MMKQRIESLRKLMQERRIDAYLVPTADFHESEYVGDYFKCRAYLTGFTGSAGTAVITLDEAGVWTDGRYFVQAEEELAGSGIDLYKMGQPTTPTIEDFLKTKLPLGGVLGFDGRVVNAATGNRLRQVLAEKKIQLQNQDDLVGMIWSDRPALSAAPVWRLADSYAGDSAAQKIAKVREAMNRAGADVHILTTLDDIMWLLNIRGNDTPCNPVALSFAVLTLETVHLFIQKEALTTEISDYLTALGVTLQAYDEVYSWLSKLQQKVILLEQSRVNDLIFQSLDASNQKMETVNPTVLLKAVKNAVEIANLKRAHVKDGVAVTKFLYWLKTEIGKVPMTELSAAKRLEQFRKEQEGYLEPSFETISAYREHAAIVHYTATPKTDKELQAAGLYLVDSGGQYYEGTTDITRTVALGPITAAERLHVTLAVMGMLRLGRVKFLHGCTGVSLDYVAREPLWARGINYDHGTGHGVGYLLNVHERPNGIRYHIVPERMDSSVLEAGMVTSDEPGVYIAGSHGVRIENLLLCQEAEKTDFGQFMTFEFLTYVPLDRDAVDISLFEKKDVEYWNQYHEKVYETISPYLAEAEKNWLFEITRPIRQQ